MALPVLYPCFLVPDYVPYQFVEDAHRLVHDWLHDMEMAAAFQIWPIFDDVTPTLRTWCMNCSAPRAQLVPKTHDSLPIMIFLMYES